MSSRALAAVLVPWALAPCADLALFAGDLFPSPAFVPAHVYDALALWETFFALLLWPALLPRARAARHAALLGAMAALLAPFAVVCASLARVPWTGVASTQGLVALYLAGGIAVSSAAPAAPRGWLACMLAASAGLPLLGYLAAETGGAAPAALFLASPFYAIVVPSTDAGGASLWVAHFWGFAAAAAVCAIVRRRRSSPGP